MRRVEKEKGAIAVIVAVLMVAMLGFAAIGVDVANMASDKQQLQNGADAAALAIAQSCAKDEPECNNTDGSATSTAFASSNRLDSGAAGMVETAGLSPATGEVTVRTTGTTNHWFAPILGYEASTINAEATAVWDPPSGAASFPLTISYCELTAQDGVITNPDGSVTVGATSEIMTFFMTGFGDEDNNGCDLATGAAGSIPGGFAHLDALPGDEPGSCYATTTVDDEGTSVGSDPGNGPDSDCENAWFMSLLGEKVLIPVFNAVQGTGQSATYEIYGYAAFILYGYYLNPGQYSEYLDPPLDRNPCSGNARCIAGQFVEWSFSDEIANVGGPSPDLGATVVRLSR